MPESEKKKSDLKLFGEIDKRVAQLSPEARRVLASSLRDVNGPEYGLMQQIRQRFVDLSDEGQAYVDKQLAAQK